MKLKFTFIAVLCFFLFTGVYAQSSFSVQYDTVFSSPVLGVSTTITDGVTAASGTVTLNWKVIASDFPADWISGLAICDNGSCYPITSLWSASSGTVGTETSHPYSTVMGDFHMLGTFTAPSTTGCHYMTVRMNNQAVPLDTAYETYLVCNNGTTAIEENSRPAGDVVLYPNPAHDEINAVYDAAYDVKTIVVYNVIGKISAVFRVSDNSSANLDLSNVPAGFYFLRFLNSTGDVVITRKFTKQ